MLSVFEHVLKFLVVSPKHLIASQSEEPLYENDTVRFIISTTMAASKATGLLANLSQIGTFLFIELAQSHEAL